MINTNTAQPAHVLLTKAINKEDCAVCKIKEQARSAAERPTPSNSQSLGVVPAKKIKTAQCVCCKIKPDAHNSTTWMYKQHLIRKYVAAHRAELTPGTLTLAFKARTLDANQQVRPHRRHNHRDSK